MLSINCKGRLLSFEQPVVMGIINTTPDSFYRDSRHAVTDEVCRTAERMLQEGAGILDVGGQSTRPGSERVSAAEEMERVIPAIAAIHRQFPEAIISVDTFYASVAEQAVAAGASIVNDVSGGSIDEAMFATVGKLNVPYVLMHMQGDPQTMQTNPVYHNVVLEVFDYLHFKLAELHKLGIKDVILDPGFGFGKTTAHNFQLLKELSFFQQLHSPLLIGLSRKGMVHKTLQVTAEDSLNGTTVLNTFALLNGAHLLRVHDVKEAVQAVKLMQVYKSQ